VSVSAPEPRDGARRTAKGTARTFLLAAVRYSGAAWIARHTVQSRRITVLAYHDPDPGVFERHVALLESLYTIVPLDTLLSALLGDGLHPLPPRALVITLDDGWAGNARLLPVLRRHDIRPAVFVATAITGTHRHFWWTHVPDPAERDRLKILPADERLRALAAIGFDQDADYPDRQALSLDEISQISAWADVEAHTRSHPILPTCTDGQAEREIAGSADEVERMTGRRPRAFAYPNGDRSPRDVALVRKAGYEAAFTVEAGYVSAASDPHALPRIDVGDDVEDTELIARASGVFSALARRGRRASGAPSAGPPTAP
jgi:peptidoglycan/xylan/chitin deacetylase (PgdA/CDA1 family)